MRLLGRCSGDSLRSLSIRRSGGHLGSNKQQRSAGANHSTTAAPSAPKSHGNFRSVLSKQKHVQWAPQQPVAEGRTVRLRCACVQCDLQQGAADDSDLAYPCFILGLFCSCPTYGNTAQQLLLCRGCFCCLLQESSNFRSLKPPPPTFS